MAAEGPEAQFVGRGACCPEYVAETFVVVSEPLLWFPQAAVVGLALDMPSLLSTLLIRHFIQELPVHQRARLGKQSLSFCWHMLRNTPMLVSHAPWTRPSIQNLVVGLQDSAKHTGARNVARMARLCRVRESCCNIVRDVCAC